MTILILVAVLLTFWPSSQQTNQQIQPSEPSWKYEIPLQPEQSGLISTCADMSLLNFYQQKNCMCDSACAIYGDCCQDSEYFVAVEQRRGASNMSCMTQINSWLGYYMVSSCPPEWKDPLVRLKCEGTGKTLFLSNTSDPLKELPLTINKTGFSYRNSFCALCNGEKSFSRLDFWTLYFKCPEIRMKNMYDEKEQKMLQSQIRWNRERSSWVLKQSDCVIKVDPPSNSVWRTCISQIKDYCPDNWTDDNVRSQCESFSSIVFFQKIAFRNVYCAICNNVDIIYLSNKREMVYAYPLPSFSVLFDWTDANEGNVGEMQQCPNPDQLFDPFNKICRQILCEDDRILKEEKCIALHSSSSSQNSSTRIYKNNSVDFLECPKFVLSKLKYILENSSSVWVPAYNRRFKEFRIDEDGSLILCSDSIGISYINKFGTYMSYVTLVGLVLSIIFLLLHLCAFLMVTDLHHLSGKNLASYCLALLMAYCSFITGQLMDINENACSTTASFTHYAFLSAFAWMLILAFDVWRSTKLATSELHLSSGRQTHKFFAYSLFCWLSPLVFVIPALAIDSAHEGNVDNTLRPGFGIISCWFANRKALLVFFGVPIIIVMAFNILFFVHTAYLIWSTTSSSPNSSTHTDFRLYGRLALIMGLTWSIGIVAGYVNIEELWYVFIVLNTLQGLFIFLAFTCKKKVAKGVLAHWRSFSSFFTDSKRPLRLAFWSTDSESTRKTTITPTTSEIEHPKDRHN